MLLLTVTPDMIEAWGRGFDKIKAACDALYHTPVPEYDITTDGIMVHCKANQRYLELSGQEWVKADDPIMPHSVMTNCLLLIPF